MKTKLKNIPHSFWSKVKTKKNCLLRHTIIETNEPANVKFADVSKLSKLFLACYKNGSFFATIDHFGITRIGSWYSIRWCELPKLVNDH